MSTSEQTESVSKLKSYIGDIVSECIRKEFSIQDALELAVGATQDMSSADLEEVGDDIVSRVSDSRLMQSEKGLDLINGLLDGLEVNRLGSPLAYLQAVIEDSVNTDRDVEDTIQAIADRKKSGLVPDNLESENLDDLVQEISNAQFKSSEKPLSLTLGFLDSFKDTRFKVLTPYFRVIFNHAENTEQALEEIVAMAVTSQREHFPEKLDVNDTIIELGLPIWGFSWNRDQVSKNQIALFNGVVDGLEFNKKEVLNAILEQGSRINHVVLKNAAEKLGKGKEADKVRTAAYQSLLKGDTSFGRKRPRVGPETAKDLALILLKPAQYGIAYNYIEQSALKMGVWHWSGYPEGAANALAEVSKTFDGDIPDGKKVRRIIDYVDNLVENSERTTTLHPAPRALDFLQAILKSDMPMSTKAREQVFDKIVDLSINVHENVYKKDEYSSRDLEVFERISVAAETYFASFEEESIHPAELNRLELKKQQTCDKLVEFVMNDSVSNTRDLDKTVTSIVSENSYILKTQGAEESFKLALEVIEQAVQSNDEVTASGVTQLLTHHHFAYAVPKSLKGKYSELVINLNIEGALDDKASDRARENTIETLVEAVRYSNLEQKMQLIEQFAQQVTSVNQQAQLEGVFKIASKILPKDEGLLFAQPSFSATRMNGDLYLAYNNVTTEGCDILVHDGELKPLAEAARAFAGKYPTSAVARQHERVLRHMVREGAYVAFGVKAPISARQINL